jgi:hypothetical protein
MSGEGTIRSLRRPGMIHAAVLMQIAAVICAAPLYVAAGLTFEWSSVGGQALIAAIFALGAIAAHRDTNGVPQALWAISLLLTAWLIFGPLQYVAASWNRPLIDGWLLRQDDRSGIARTSIDYWLTAHPTARHVIGLSYISFLPQFILVPIVLGWVDRRRLWRFVVQFQLIALFTVVLFGLFPAGTPALHGVHEWLSQASAMDQFFRIRAGTLRVIDLTEATGLISWPSFHTAGALLVVWTLRGTWFFWPILVVDGLLVVSTVLLGVHYVADVWSAIGLTVLVVWITESRRWRPRGRVSPSHGTQSYNTPTHTICSFMRSSRSRHLVSKSTAATNDA